MAIRSLAAGKGSKNPFKQDSGGDGGYQTVWKAIALVLFGIILLMATGSLEIKVSGGDALDESAKFKSDPDLKYSTGSSNASPGDVPNPALEPTVDDNAPPPTTPAANDSPVPDSFPASVPAPVPADTDRITYQTRSQPISGADHEAMIAK
jgi:hypothetical protein